MALIDMVMPKMGESIMECTVITWLKQPGDLVDVDESVLEVATDKVDTEVPASHAGILKEILVKDGDVVAVGAPIARIETKESVIQEPESTAPVQHVVTKANQTPKGIGDVANVPAEVESVNGTEDTETLQAARELENTISLMSSHAAHVPKAVAVSANKLADEYTVFADRFYSPLVLKIAKEEGISRDELDRIPGSGAENRVTKKDILAYVIIPDPNSDAPCYWLP
jgi:2-oxoglutarate dehydrogenase E2 component (dihydrolipoamide succinyltransferase)